MSRFTKEQTAVIVGTYVADAEGLDYDARTAVVKDLADEFKVTENVIRGVLVAEGVYVKKEVTAAKAAAGRVDKAALAKSFTAFLGGLELKSLGNMTGKDMQALWDRLVEMSDIRNVETGKTV